MSKKARPRSGAPALSGREQEVVDLLATGTSTDDIAAKLFISPATVRNHVQSILTKTDSRSRLEAVASVAAGPQPVQPSTHILECLSEAGVDVSQQQKSMIVEEFTCTHECPVHPHVPH
jgi:DNA-binding CsgD family transcriptional regulator